MSTITKIPLGKNGPLVSKLGLGCMRMSPSQWLQEKRLSEARHLIESKHRKPSDFYLDLGFESLSHFSRSFKNKYGKAPAAL